MYSTLHKCTSSTFEHFVLLFGFTQFLCDKLTQNKQISSRKTMIIAILVFCFCLFFAKTNHKEVTCIFYIRRLGVAITEKCPMEPLVNWTF